MFDEPFEDSQSDAGIKGQVTGILGTGIVGLYYLALGGWIVATSMLAGLLDTLAPGRDLEGSQ